MTDNRIDWDLVSHLFSEYTKKLGVVFQEIANASRLALNSFEDNVFSAKELKKARHRRKYYRMMERRKNDKFL